VYFIEETEYFLSLRLGLGNLEKQGYLKFPESGILLYLGKAKLIPSAIHRRGLNVKT